MRRGRAAGLAALAALVGLVTGGGAALAEAEPAAATPSVAADVITGFDVRATVHPDGSMDVVETLDITLVDPCNGAYRTIPEGDYEITDLAVTEGGEPRPFASTDLDDIRWYAAADREPECGPQTFELSYTVEGAVDVAPDVGDLHWQFVGEDFPSVDAVSVTVTFPGDGAGLRAFGHGSLHGVVDVRGTTVTMTVDDNPAGAPVELRAVYPSSHFTVPPRGEPVLDEILAEEAALAEEANRRRETQQQEIRDELVREVEEGIPGECDGATGELAESCEELAHAIAEGERLLDGPPSPEDDAARGSISVARLGIEAEMRDRGRTRLGRIAGGLTVAVVAAGLGALALIWRRWGRDPAPEGGGPRSPAGPGPAGEVGPYWRELPEQSPAVVAAFLTWGKVDATAFTATVVDLAQRGWLTIARDGDDVLFVQGRPADGDEAHELRDYELMVLDRLFTRRKRMTATQQVLTDEATRHPVAAAMFMDRFKAAVAAEYEASGFDAPRSRLGRRLAIAVVVVLAVAGACVTPISPLGLVAVAAAIGGGLMVPRLRQRTPRGARLAAELRGLTRYLRDFSTVDDVPVGHLALYERYLVYAVALGVADELAAALRLRFPELAQPDSGFAPWFTVPAGVPAGGGGDAAPSGGFGALGGFADGLSAAATQAFSPPSSAGGGGGGFSGGGSSTGGGGGGGAGGW